jgi:hypothetical protein
MRNKLIPAILLPLVLAVFSLGFVGDIGGGKKRATPSSNRLAKPTAAQASGKVGEAYLFNINNIAMPISNAGVIAEVSVSGVGEGQFNGQPYLFAGGFFLSGKAGDQVWCNAVAPASRIEDYLPGRVTPGPDDDNQIYVVDANDPPFGEAWQIWADAVKMGADFYDGDGDNAYNPVDKDNDGQWDSNEDRPDLLGDQTAWCVFNDSRRSADRRFVEEVQRGIEVQQTMFGFRSAGLLGNILFLRYRIFNRGTTAPVFDDCYFGLWQDPDIGGGSGYTDDLVGCDTLRNGGFTWNDGDDPTFGANPPCNFVDFFQGPIAYIAGESFTDTNNNGVYDPGVDAALDTAYNVKGQVKGVEVFPGAKNLPLSSFVNYVQSDPVRGDPNTVSEGRSYMLGRLRDGSSLDPCDDDFGTVFGIPCTSVPNNFWYSGSVLPAPGVGWIYTTPSDMRQMQNVGPFRLEKDQPVDIVVAYIVGRGTNARTSVVEAQRISDFAQFIYDKNFQTPPPPPAVTPTVRTTENSIELIWDTAPQAAFVNKTVAWDMRFEGYEVTMYRINSTGAVEAGLENSRVIARFDLANNIDDILAEDGATGERVKKYLKGTQLDPQIYKNPQTGRLAVRVDVDPFTGGPLIKGKPYFLSVTGYALNYDALKAVDPAKTTGNYYLDGTAFVGSTANLPVILRGDQDGLRPGLDFNDPFQINAEAPKATGNIGDGTVTFDEVDKSRLTGNNYQVSFFKDVSSPKYSVFWRLTNTTTNAVKLDSQKTFNLAAPNTFASGSADGFVVRVDKVDPAVKTPTYSSTTTWFKPFAAGATGAFYPAEDLPVGTGVPGAVSNRFSRLVSAENLRQVEIRFGPSQNVYRYVPKRLTGYSYGADPALALPDTASKKGYISVPFQVWVKDTRYGQEQQMAAAIIESRNTADGKWDPGTSIATSREYILVFNSAYTGADTVRRYTGGTFGTLTRYADIILGWAPPAGAMSAQDSTIARNPWADALYIVGLERNDAASFFRNGEILTIPVAYPFIGGRDVFTFKTNKRGEALTADDRKTQFNRVNVYPNPLFAFNPTSSYIRTAAGQPTVSDDAFVTFSNLPEDVTIRIFSLSGSLIRTLTSADKRLGQSSPFLDWNLQNENGLRVASGMYIAVVTSPNLGEKVLKLAIIMPQKQIQRF